MKENRKIVIASCLLCLVPLIFSLAVYSRLPEQMAVHWDASGEANGYAGRFVGAFGLPALLLAVQLLCCAGILYDPKKRNQSSVMRNIGIWCIPVLNLIIHPIMLLSAMGKALPITTVITMMIGVLFIICGNYMPKTRQNYSIGIKLPWTLDDRDNWNKTHRLAGVLWIICGILLLARPFIGRTERHVYLDLALILVMILIPIGYSFLLHLKKVRES